MLNLPQIIVVNVTADVPTDSLVDELTRELNVLQENLTVANSKCLTADINGTIAKMINDISIINSYINVTINHSEK